MSNRTKLTVGALGLGVAIAAFAAYQYNRNQIASQQATNSLQAGISQTKGAIAQIDQEMDHNQTDLDRLYNELTVDFAAQLAKVPVRANRTALEAFQQDPLNTTKGLFDQFQSSSRATTSLQDAQYLEALGQGAKTIGQLWGLFNPAMATSQEAEEVLIKSVEVHGLLNQQARLNEIRGQLEQQLVRLDGKDPQHLAELDNIYKNLFGDPNAAHAAFLQAAAAAKADSQQLMAKALKDAASRSETSALQMAQGLSIIDPDQNLWDLANWPGINPDFINTLNQCFQATRQMNQENQTLGTAESDCSPTPDNGWANCPAVIDAGRHLSAAIELGYNCGHYSDGSYIPAFGPSRNSLAVPSIASSGVADSSSTDIATITYTPAQISGSTGKRLSGFQWTGTILPGVEDPVYGAAVICPGSVAGYSWELNKAGCGPADNERFLEYPPGNATLSVGPGVMPGNASGNENPDNRHARIVVWGRKDEYEHVSVDESKLVSARGIPPIRFEIREGMVANVSLHLGAVHLYRSGNPNMEYHPDNYMDFYLLDSTGKTEFSGRRGFSGGICDQSTGESGPYYFDVNCSWTMAPGAYLIKIRKGIKESNPPRVETSSRAITVTVGKVTEVSLQ